MLTTVILVETINEAVDKILDELKEDAAGTTSSSSSSTSRHKIIYFDGWDGLGASAVLRTVHRRLTPEAGKSSASSIAGLEFSHIFHIDCSKWESRRAMQRMIAEQLKLPGPVMEMFDAQDEEDDYQGVAKGARSEIPRIAQEINRQIQKLTDRFLLIFHNGSSEEIDLDRLGFPLFDRYSRSKVLWSFQGRFRVYPRMKVDGALKNTRTTDVFLSADSSHIGEDKLSDIMHHEAEEVAREMINNNVGSIDWVAATTNCFLYVLKLCRMGNDMVTDYDVATHVCNHWRCDGIIQLQRVDIDTDDGVDKLWLSSDAMHREMRMDVHVPSPVESRLLKHMAYWISPTYGFMMILDPHGQIPKGMFQHFDKLCVLKLSACMFSFTSPPFLCCHNLRFLWLDHCRDGSSAAEAVKKEDIGRFFQRLWVLDVRYSNKAFLSDERMGFMTQLRELNVMGEREWLDKGALHGRLNNIHKLRVTKSDVPRHDLYMPFVSRMDKLELLEFSGNMSYNLNVENCKSLENVIIYGSTPLSFISLTGCAKLKNLFLRGSFPDLYGIFVAGAIVETLDLSAVTAPKLGYLYVLECEMVRAILWPSSAEDKRKVYLSRLHIDTKRKEGTASDTSTPPSAVDYWNMVIKKMKFYWRISVRDTRILRSLEPVKDYFGANDACVEVSTLSSTHPCADAAGSKNAGTRSSSGQHVQLKQPKDNATYADAAAILKDASTQQRREEEANEGDRRPPGIMTTCPHPPDVPSDGCYIHIEDPIGRNKSQAGASIAIPGFICDGAKVLHVHGSLHISRILAAPLASAAWNKLEWCRVERCPKLECVFSPQLGEGPEGSNNNTDMFKKLRTVWASELPSARYIWNWTGSSTTWYRGATFEDLTLLHLDCCPRLINIVHYPTVYRAFDRLERLEIMWCSDLNVAFHFYDTSYVSTNSFDGWIFPELKHVCLHELPKLQNMCNIGFRILMPELETIKIRGCWSLRTLPVIKTNNVVECDCEKEWWDKLQWESEEDASRYKLIHPRYYKKTVLRSSVLR